ncbi:MAG TPA: polysaccharide deacetylase family protein [Chitinophagaceae bacterium]|nr:polysaccharide deacetylase family protein [Chitinophagaceae bacterium]
MKNRTLIALAILAMFCSCDLDSPSLEGKMTASITDVPALSASSVGNSPFPANKILAQKQLPILCYHRIRSWKPTDTRSMKDYIVPVETFKEHIRKLADSGYKTILPDQLYAYLTTGTPLPAKSVMLTFDDSEEEHYTIAAAEMKKYGFKGVFFLMTVTMDRPGYLNKEQIKALSNEGHIIGSHTWDHHNVKKYQGKDWETQIEKPTKQIQSITGKPVKYFAYPFGLWNEEAIPQLKKRGMSAAFQLTEKRSQSEPLFTIRRMIVPGDWNANQLIKRIKVNF